MRTPIERVVDLLILQAIGTLGTGFCRVFRWCFTSEQKADQLLSVLPQEGLDLFGCFLSMSYVSTTYSFQELFLTSGILTLGFFLGSSGCGPPGSMDSEEKSFLSVSSESAIGGGGGSASTTGVLSMAERSRRWPLRARLIFACSSLICLDVLAMSRRPVGKEKRE